MIAIPEMPDEPLNVVLIDTSNTPPCERCESTTVLRFIWFGPVIGCIQEQCPKYWSGSNERKLAKLERKAARLRKRMGK